MSAISDFDLEGTDREKTLERLLYSLEGQRLPAVNVMEQIGMVFEMKRDAANELAVIPPTAFVDFVFLLRRVSGFFAGHGFAVRWGGKPVSNVWIEHLRS
jgi:hypothetical protein